MPKAKHIIMKGWEGFGDRLQGLTYCMWLAENEKRILHVDWKDSIWNDSFFKYFKIKDIKTIEKEPKRKNVHPIIWSEINYPKGGEWLYHIKEWENIENRDEECVVYSGIGYRRYDYSLISDKLRLTDEVKKLIKNKTKTLTKMPLVHLRGTDRGFDPLNWKNLRKKVKTAYVLSDDKMLSEMWMEESPNSIILHDGHFSKSAYHKSKGAGFERNIKLLSDFITIANAKEAHALNEESLFFKIPRYIGKNIKKWFDN